MRRRYRTYHLDELDRLMAESEAIRRAVEAGARDAWVRDCHRIVDADTGRHQWRIVVRVSRPKRSRRREPS